jgi:hydrogenase maturation protease
MRLRHRVEPEPLPAGPIRVIIGGVGYRWQRDGSFGLEASDELAELDWPDWVAVADLGYGAIYAAQDIGDVRPQRLILLAATVRDREPGRLYAYQWPALPVPPEEIQARIYEAGAGVIDLDHLLIIGRQFGALPEDVLLIELEPVDMAGGLGLSAQAAALLPQAVDLARNEALATEALATEAPATEAPATEAPAKETKR